MTTRGVDTSALQPGAAMGDVDTPALIVDLDLMASNIEAMAELGRDGGLAIRPHIKSHKVPELALMQMEAGAVGITCQKLGEAEVMADAGLADITVAYPIIGALKLRRLTDLARRIRVTTLVDSMEGAKPLSDAAASTGITLDTLVEVDDGYHRCGVPPEQVLPLARAVAQELPGLRFAGILAYEGHIYDLTDRGVLLREARRSYDVMREVAERVRDAGIPSNASAWARVPPRGRLRTTPPSLSFVQEATSSTTATRSRWVRWASSTARSRSWRPSLASRLRTARSSTWDRRASAGRRRSGPTATA